MTPLKLTTRYGGQQSFLLFKAGQYSCEQQFLFLVIFPWTLGCFHLAAVKQTREHRLLTQT